MEVEWEKFQQIAPILQHMILDLWPGGKTVHNADLVNLTLMDRIWAAECQKHCRDQQC